MASGSAKRRGREPHTIVVRPDLREAGIPYFRLESNGLPATESPVRLAERVLMTPIHTFMKEMEQISKMKISSLAKYAVGATVAAAMLAACSSGGTSSFGPSAAPSGHGIGMTSLSKIQDAALTQPHFVNRPVHTDHGKSFMNMSPDKKKKGLLYVGDWATNDVYVYNYPSGSSAGTLTGFDAPYGMCADKKGDVFIDNFYAGTTVEYKHGGTAPINTYTGVGEPIGCSVSAKGDLAVTSFNPGEVIVFAGGDPSKGKTYTGSCEFQWTMGYDHAGDIIGIGEEGTGSIVACALMNGSSSETVLSGCCTGPVQIDFPGGSSWDGKYIGLGDQEATGTFLSGTWPSTLSGTTLSSSKETDYSDSCFSNYDDTVNAFFVGGKKMITPNTKKQAKLAVGPNLWCNDSGTSAVDYWSYPAGGTPKSHLSGPPAEPYGTAVSY